MWSMYIMKYIGPYQIVRKICKVAYELELPADLGDVHPIIHVFHDP